MESHNTQGNSQRDDSTGKISDEIAKDLREVDSPINKDFDRQSDGNKSLTNDEDADTDPNEVDNKPSFKNDNN